MKRPLSYVALLLAALWALAGCGGEAATSTPMAADPTATVAVLPTNTTAMVEATPTTQAATATMMPATATTAPATATRAATPASAGAATPTGARDTTGAATPTLEAENEQPTATAGVGGMLPNSGPAAGDWDAALEKMRGLTSYHQEAVVLGTVNGEASETRMSANMIPPDRAHITVTTGLADAQSTTEVIQIAGETWSRVSASGMNLPWTKSEMPIPDLNAGLQQSGGFQNITRVGEDTIDGTAAWHYTFDVDTSQPGGDTPASIGSGEAWIAKDSGYLVRLVMETEAEMGEQSVESQTTIDYSRFNDPTITVEPPPEPTDT